MKKTFDIGTLFRSAWSDYKQNWGMFIFIVIIFGLVLMVSNLGTTINPATGMLEQSPIISIIGWLLQTFIMLGFIRFLLNLVDEKGHALEDLFKGPQSLQHFIHFAVVGLLYGAIVGLGTLLFIIPGLVVLVGFFFAQYLMAEQKTGIFESFKESWKMTRGNRWKIFWLLIVTVFFNIFGAIALLIGLFITLPMTYIIYARLYRTLGEGVVVKTDDHKDEKEGDEVIIAHEETIIVETEDDEQK